MNIFFFVLFLFFIGHLMRMKICIDKLFGKRDEKFMKQKKKIIEKSLLQNCKYFNSIPSIILVRSFDIIFLFQFQEETTFWFQWFEWENSFWEKEKINGFLSSSYFFSRIILDPEWKIVEEDDAKGILNEITFSCFWKLKSQTTAS